MAPLASLRKSVLLLAALAVPLPSEQRALGRFYLKVKAFEFYDTNVDAAAPCSPACGPTVILSSGKESWGPGLDAPLFRSPTAAKREA